jgi:hypothetical protein
METLQVNGNKTALTDGNSSLLLEVDAANNLVQLKADGPPQPDLQVRLEIDHQAMSISLLNHSDLGLVLDNNGLTTIYSAEIQTAFLRSENGGRFRLIVGNDGALSAVPA